MKMNDISAKTVILLGATALTMSLGHMVGAQPIADCELEDGVLPLGCEQPNATTTTTTGVASNTEPSTPPARNDLGFVLSIDGETIDADPRIENQIRQTDVALAQADIRISFDGLNPEPRLNVETVGLAQAYAPGETVALKSEMNYPALVAAGEIRIIDRGAAGGPRLLVTAPIEPNGTVSIQLPNGIDLVAVHRVTDARGRFDETEPLPLFRPDDRGLRADIEEGFDFTAERNIPIRGGAVTVAANQVAPGARLFTLGEVVTPDPSGKLVIQRILPAGDYAVDVAVRGGAAQPTELSRDITIPGSDWFYFVLADLTYGRFSDGSNDETETRTTGRLRYYIDGETATGVQITSSLDTTEDELDQLFRRLDEKDPRSVLQRLDPKDTYPTFGDDSSSFDNTPTSGKIYLRIAQDGNFALWGDYQSQIAGSAFLRNERTLYGAQVYYGTQATTSKGEARASISLYAAQPDQLVGRDVFQGTGGSLYFLRQQDITIGSETITIELRDADTGRVVDRRALIEGRDYKINYIQGYVRLSAPLSSSGNPNLIQTNPGGDVRANLVAQYEYTPAATDVDGLAYGGRIEGWVTDDVRLGVTGTSDDTGVAEQNAAGVDLRYELGDNSFVQLDYAETDGPGYGTNFSTDGGLIIDETVSSAGSGRAVRVEGQADLADLGYSRTGVLGAYYEDRTSGFTTLDYETTEDETLFGAFARVEATDDTLGWAMYGDRRETQGGTEKTEVGAELSGQITPALSYEIGAEFLEEQSIGSSGDRTTLGARLEYAASENLSYSIFGQVTVANRGDLDVYDRYGVGVTRSFDNGWALSAELSDGTGGVGGRLLAEQSRNGNSSAYFGYELDPGRAIDAGISPSANGGRYILGGRRQINNDVQLFGENTYDIFDTSRKLTSAYGVEYTATEFLTYDVAVELGQVEDSENGNFDRRAVSFGTRYEDESLIGRARIEFRQERADDVSLREDADTILFSSDMRYEISETQRLLFSLDAADTETDASSLLDGSLVDASLGYAYRPIDNERLNILTRYRYLYDMYGQDIDGTVETGPVQESHVFSIEGNYDIDRYWTIGGKLGGRFSESAIDGEAPLTRNDAALAIISARYNVVQNWDVLIEARQFEAFDAELSETSFLGVVSRSIGDNAKIGVGYNFGAFSDDLTDLTYDDQGAFLNLVASY